MNIDHSVSHPYRVVLDLLRCFFEYSDHLIYDENNEPVLANNDFRYDPSAPEGSRLFDIVVAGTTTETQDKILPIIVIKRGGQQEQRAFLQGVTTREWAPILHEKKHDLIQTSIEIHCQGRTDAQSELLAAIVARVLSGYVDVLYRFDVQRVWPLAITDPQPLRSEGGHVDRWDVVISMSMSFEAGFFIEHKRMMELRHFIFRYAPNKASTGIAGYMDICNPFVSRGVECVLDVEAATARGGIECVLDVDSPISSSFGLYCELDVGQPASSLNGFCAIVNVG